MTDSSKVHFLTGKGGVGKTTLACALALKLAEKQSGPVLVIDANGPGRVLKNLGAPTSALENQKIVPLGAHNNLWGIRISPRESFREYFEESMSLGKNIFASATAALREKIVESVVNNKIVSAFVNICPGLEPSVLIGKIFHEATKGICEDNGLRWAHIVVDAPATGHGIMMFKSPFALSEVFKTGPIGHSALKIRDFFLNPDRFEVLVVSLLNEHSLKEAEEILHEIKKLGFKKYRIILNRILPPLNLKQETSSHPSLTSQLEYFNDEQQNQIDLLKHLKSQESIDSLEVPDMADQGDTPVALPANDDEIFRCLTQN